MILTLYFLPIVLSYQLHQIPEFGNPPTARYHYSIVYDSSVSTLLLFGGIQEGRGYLNDIWSYSLPDKKWSLIYPQSFSMPQPRSDFTMSIDNSDRKLYLFGGRTKIGISDEFWVYSIETKIWREINGIGKPSLNTSKVKSCLLSRTTISQFISIQLLVTLGVFYLIKVPYLLFDMVFPLSVTITVS
jgi:hypothetical protein